MKKLLLSPKFIALFALVGLLAAGCGLKISKIGLSTDKPEQGSTLTMIASFTEIEHNADDYYNLLAVRVPSDWSGRSLSVKGNGADGMEMVASEAYAAFCEYCFPREGYKWVAFQSTAMAKLAGDLVATVNLGVGEAMGEYNLDLVAGGWNHDPAELLKDGQVNIALAFGNTIENKPTTDDPTGGTNGTYFKSSEYLFIAGTISDAEMAANKSRLSSVKLTAYNMTLPIAPDVANLMTAAELAEANNLKVEVVAGAGVEAVEADGANGPVEWFTLQGVRVENPANGLYIRRQGNAVSKVYVK